MSPNDYRLSALRAYLIEVAKDLIKQGKIDRQGKSLDTILRTEFFNVAATVGEDLTTIAGQFSISLGDYLLKKFLPNLK